MLSSYQPVCLNFAMPHWADNGGTSAVSTLLQVINQFLIAVVSSCAPATGHASATRASARAATTGPTARSAQPARRTATDSGALPVRRPLTFGTFDPLSAQPHATSLTKLS